MPSTVGATLVAASAAGATEPVALNPQELYKVRMAGFGNFKTHKISINQPRRAEAPPRHMAPELIGPNGELRCATKESDVYAFGVVRLQTVAEFGLGWLTGCVD